MSVSSDVPQQDRCFLLNDRRGGVMGKWTVQGIRPLRMTSHVGFVLRDRASATVQSAAAEVEHLGPDRPVRVEAASLSETPTCGRLPPGPQARDARGPCDRPCGAPAHPRAPRRPANRCCTRPHRDRHGVPTKLRRECGLDAMTLASFRGTSTTGTPVPQLHDHAFLSRAATPACAAIHSGGRHASFRPRAERALRPAVRRYHGRLPRGVHRRCITWRSSSGPTTPA